jgi:hypothetical protein
MNPKIEVIEGALISDKDVEKFRHKMKQFAEVHKVINVSTAMTSGSRYGGPAIVATILYEEVDNQ